MSYKILTYEQIDRTQWASFVESHPKGNVFHTPEMYDVYAQTPGYEPHVIVLEQDKHIEGVLLWVVMREKCVKARFSARSIIHGAPLAKDDKPEYIVSLLEAYEQTRDKSVIYTQVRNHFEMLTVNDAYQQCGYRFESHLNFIITLDNEEAAWNRIGKGRIKQIKKAQKNGLYVDVYEPGQITDELIVQGYDVIRSVYLRAGLPLTDLEQNKKYVLFSSKFTRLGKDPELAKNVVGIVDKKRRDAGESGVELLPLTGGYTKEEMVSLMNAVDAAIVTSKSEGSPQFTKEVMSCGCPIVSVDVGDVAEQVDGLEGCYIAQSREPEELAALLRKAIDYGKTKGHQHIIDMQLDNEQVAERLVNIYRKIIK